jgi:CRP/FNR family transcriptional regulator, cyclic AMP receptor protein
VVRNRESNKVRVTTQHRPSIDPWLLVSIGLPVETARELSQRMSWQRLPRGALLGRRGEPADHWGHVHSGLVASAVPLREAGGEATAPESASRVAQLYGCGAWFGEAALVEGSPRPLEYRTLAPSLLGFMPARDFRAALDAHPLFARFVLNLVSHRAARTLQWLLALKHASPAGRIVWTLAHLCESLDEGSAWSPAPALAERVAVGVGQTELAHACDVSRRLLNGVLQSLAAAGFLQVSYGRIELSPGAAWRGVAERLRSSAVFEGEQPLGAFIDLLARHGHAPP